MTSADHRGIRNVAVTGVPVPLPDGLHVLDVREDVEWVQGHIDGAVHIPLRDLPGRLAEVPRGEVLVVCRVGGRSAHAAGYLQQRGHDVVNLHGGMLEWEAAGRPMVSELGRPARVV
jgi:rhodanese-related sulfurtransferase